MEGSNNPKIKAMTELIMQKAEKNLLRQGERTITVYQYNALFAAVQEVLEDNI